MLTEKVDVEMLVVRYNSKRKNGRSMSLLKAVPSLEFSGSCPAKRYREVVVNDKTSLVVEQIQLLSHLHI